MLGLRFGGRVHQAKREPLGKPRGSMSPPARKASSGVNSYGATWTCAVPGTPPTGAENTEDRSFVLRCPDSGTVMVTGVSPPITTPVIVMVVPVNVHWTSPLSATAPVGPIGVRCRQSEPV